MLRKFVASEAQTWDQYLPYLLYAYREVPQASTGFLPFELMFGRHVCGPLELLHDSLLGENTSDQKGVVSYVTEMRERLKLVSEHVEDHLAHAPESQKEWFDRGGRIHEFSLGDRVLVFLPTVTSKLQAEWQGPYVIVKRDLTSGLHSQYWKALLPSQEVPCEYVEKLAGTGRGFLHGHPGST